MDFLQPGHVGAFLDGDDPHASSGCYQAYNVSCFSGHKLSFHFVSWLLAYRGAHGIDRLIKDGKRRGTSIPAWL